MPTGSGLNFATTPNMGLSQPTPGVCGPIGVEPPGKSWMELFNASMAVIDQHTHAPGFGALVPTAGLNINADLSFNANDAIGLRSTRFSAIALGSLAANDVGCLVVSGVDLYYVDGSGNQVRITTGGAIAGTPGSIGGLIAPGSATYTPASKLFTFLSSAPRVASLAIGPVSIGDASVDNGKSATISVPAALAANYALTLPAALPAATGLLSLSSTGVMSTFGTVIGANVLGPVGANTTLSLLGNRTGSDAGAEVAITGQALRTAGFLLDIQNNSSSRLRVDFQGLLSLAAQATPLQPSSIYTALTPNTNVVAGNGAAYWKDADGIVHLKGKLTNSTGGVAVNLVSTTPLPVGFRPSFQRGFSCPGLGPRVYQVFVGTDGSIACSASNNGDGTTGSGIVNGDAVHIDTIKFAAEA
jgi:hypothetical protein